MVKQESRSSQVALTSDRKSGIAGDSMDARIGRHILACLTTRPGGFPESTPASQRVNEKYPLLGVNEQLRWQRKRRVRRFPMGAANAVRIKGETSKDLVSVVTGGRRSRSNSRHC